MMLRVLAIFLFYAFSSSCCFRQSAEAKLRHKTISLDEKGFFQVKCYKNGRTVISEKTNDEPKTFGDDQEVYTKFYNTKGELIETTARCSAFPLKR